MSFEVFFAVSPTREYLAVTKFQRTPKYFNENNENCKNFRVCLEYVILQKTLHLNRQFTANDAMHKISAI